MHLIQAMYIDVPVSREQPQALREKRHSHIHALTHTPTNYKHACNHTDTLDYLPRVYKYTLQSKVYYFFWLQIGLFSKCGSVTYSNVWQDCQKIRDAITAAEPRLERAKVRVTILSSSLEIFSGSRLELKSPETLLDGQSYPFFLSLHFAFLLFWVALLFIVSCPMKATNRLFTKRNMKFKLLTTMQKKKDLSRKAN